MAKVSVASTQASSTVLRCSPGASYTGRTDALCFDADTKGPVIVIDGTVDHAFNSALLVSVYEDFLGWFLIPDVDGTDLAQTIWAQQSTNQTTAAVRVADSDDGKIAMALDSDSEAGNIGLYWGDELNIDSDTEPVCIFRLSVDATPAANDALWWGLAINRATILSSVNQMAVFSVNGADLTLDTESDDTATDVSADGTGITLTAATLYEFKVSLNSIDGASSTNVKFFYRASLGGDWTALNASATFSLGADAAVQPFVQVEKASGTGTPGVKVDYINCFWERT